jgi:hypothetical protein
MCLTEMTGKSVKGLSGFGERCGSSVIHSSYVSFGILFCIPTHRQGILQLERRS